LAVGGCLNRLAILLSGEHPTLPLSEACAVMRAEGIAYRVFAKHDQLLLVDAGVGAAESLRERIGICHGGWEAVGSISSQH